MPLHVSTKSTSWHSLCVVDVLLAFLISWGYGKYEEHKEWKRIDELFAERDKRHPQWRWHVFLPKPLQPGQENGALRFIEVGKKISEAMLTGPDYPDEDKLQHQINTREWLTNIERDSVRRCYKTIYEQCQHLETELPKLLEIKPGCPPFFQKRPFAKSVFLHEEGAVLLKDGAAWSRVLQWLSNGVKHQMNDGNGDQAILYLRAFVACNCSNTPGLFVFPKSRGYFFTERLLYQLLARSEPGEVALRELQQTISDWRKNAFQLDDVNMDRAFLIQLLTEMMSEVRWMPLTGLHTYYARPPSWLPEEWHDLANTFGVGAPSLAYIFRMELITCLRMADLLEMRMIYGKWMDDYIRIFRGIEWLMPGKYFHIYFGSQWSAFLDGMNTLDNDILCLEALVAAERYRLKHGDFPKQWSDLVPAFLKETPRSNGRKFILKPVPEGLVVYLPGEKDLGGKVLRNIDEKSNTFDNDIDKGKILFYPKYRRQPPPAAKTNPPEEE